MSAISAPSGSEVRATIAARAVNNLALQALIATFANDKIIVDESLTWSAVAEVTAE